MNEGISPIEENFGASKSTQEKIEELKKKNLELLRKRADETNNPKRGEYLELNKQIDDLELEESQSSKQNPESNDKAA